MTDLSKMRDTMAMSPVGDRMPQRTITPPGSTAAMGRLTPAPFTITEGLEAILEKQAEIKAALDTLIADATTLRGQM